MQAGAGHVAQDVGEEREIPPHGGRLRRDWPAAQPEHGRDQAIVRLGSVGQRPILGVVHDRQAEHPGIRQRVAEERRGSDR